MLPKPLPVLFVLPKVVLSPKPVVDCPNAGCVDFFVVPKVVAEVPNPLLVLPNGWALLLKVLGPPNPDEEPNPLDFAADGDPNNGDFGFEPKGVDPDVLLLLPTIELDPKAVFVCPNGETFGFGGSGGCID